MKTGLVTLAALVVLLVQLTHGGVPSTMSYQGRLVQFGQPYTGTVNMYFKLYECNQGGCTELWSETQGGVTVTDGSFEVELGSVNPLDPSMFESSGVYLGITVSHGSEMVPRTHLSASPYSFRVSTIDGATAGEVTGSFKLSQASGGPNNLEMQYWRLAFNAPTDALITANQGLNVWSTGNLSLGSNNGSASLSAPLNVTIESTAGDVSLGAAGEFTVKSNGEVLVGPGAVAEGHALSVEGDGNGLRGAAIQAFNHNSSKGIALFCKSTATTNTDATLVVSQDGTGDIIRGFAGPMKFVVTNTGRVWTSAVEIYGGGDLAEPFPMTDHEVIDAGSVVVIDPSNPGRLKLSTVAYDPLVAGIVSGAGGVNPGITLNQAEVLGDGANVALSGRVYCKVDASYGSVHPGDMLTTSTTPGHAMKATDRTRAYGAVIGKAMTGLESGKGLVLVLVSLQ